MARVPLNKPYTVTTKFGVKDGNSKFGRHTGIDYGVPGGREVLAPANGTVVSVTNETYNGRVVQIYDGTYYHRMLHNTIIKVKVGAKVKEGQVVALSGSSGLATTGPHIHWDVCKVKSPEDFSQFIDPNAWITSANKPAYPKWVRATGKPFSNVRSKPTTLAPLAGSKRLPYGTPFRVKGVVKGQNVNGSDKWYVSMYGNYVHTSVAK